MPLPCRRRSHQRCRRAWPGHFACIDPAEGRCGLVCCAGRRAAENRCAATDAVRRTGRLARRRPDTPAGKWSGVPCWGGRISVDRARSRGLHPVVLTWLSSRPPAAPRYMGAGTGETSARRRCAAEACVARHWCEGSPPGTGDWTTPLGPGLPAPRPSEGQGRKGGVERGGPSAFPPLGTPSKD